MAADLRGAAKTQPVAEPTEYRSLHKYLNERYADTIVLRFGEIEDILGFALPGAARSQAEWWAASPADGTASIQSRSWTRADRTAIVNLLAQKVVFERTSHRAG